MNKTFRIGDLFRGYNGNTDIKKEHINGKGYPVVSSGLENTGIIGFSDIEARIFPSNTITIDMFGNVFFRDFEYKIVTHARVFSLVLKDHQLTLKAGLYVASILSWLSKVFSYNNMCSYNKIAHMNISLPVIEHADPNHEYTVDDIDWQYMEDRIKELEEDRIKELDAYLKVTNLDDYELTDEDEKVFALSSEFVSNEASSWASFLVREVLNVEQTKSVVAKSNLIFGDIPYVTRTVSDNGYMGKCGNLEKMNQGNCITIGAETGVAFYQPNDFVAGNKVYRLSRDGLGEKEYLFLASVLNMQTKNYSYSNARIPEKIKSEFISLPVIPHADPEHVYTVDDIDWKYMERYIRAIEKLTIADVVKYKDKVIDTTKMLVNSQS